MTDLHFDPAVQPILATLLLIIGGATLVYYEATRKLKFRTFRIAAQIMMLIALTIILLRPSYTTRASSSAVLLTPGYATRSVDSLTTQHPALQLYHLPGAKPFKNSTALQSYHELSSLKRNVTTIVGNGLPDYALDLLLSKTYTFLPAPYPRGLIQLKGPDRFLVNRINHLHGFFYNPSPGTKLFLANPGQKEDSVVFKTSGLNAFTLSFIPKQAGLFSYTVIVKDSAGKEQQELFPVTAEQEQPMNILFFQHYPTFETQYLKTFLAKHHHRLLMRYQLSKQTYRYEYLNREPQQIAHLNAETLKGFDILFIDSDVLKSLSRSQQHLLEKAIEAGLGVLILLNESPAKIPSLKNFLPVAWKTLTADTATIAFSSAKVTSLPAWPVSPEATTLVPTMATKTRILSGYCHHGFGKAAFQLLQETYSLALSGDSVSYNSLWSALIEQTARKKQNAYRIKVLNEFPVYPEEPVFIEVVSSVNTPPVLFLDSIKLPMVEDARIDNVWRTTAWLRESGWHTLKIEGDSASSNFYIAEKGSWKPLRAANTKKSTLQRQRDTRYSEKATNYAESKAISATPFFIVFLLSACFLWLSPKL